MTDEQKRAIGLLYREGLAEYDKQYGKSNDRMRHNFARGNVVGSVIVCIKTLIQQIPALGSSRCV